MIQLKLEMFSKIKELHKLLDEIWKYWTRDIDCNKYNEFMKDKIKLAQRLLSELSKIQRIIDSQLEEKAE